MVCAGAQAVFELLLKHSKSSEFSIHPNGLFDKQAWLTEKAARMNHAQIFFVKPFDFLVNACHGSATDEAHNALHSSGNPSSIVHHRLLAHRLAWLRRRLWLVTPSPYSYEV